MACGGMVCMYWWRGGGDQEGPLHSRHASPAPTEMCSPLRIGQAFRYQVGHSYREEARLWVGEALLNAPRLLGYLGIDVLDAFFQGGDIAFKLLALLCGEACQLQLHHLG